LLHFRGNLKVRFGVEVLGLGLESFLGLEVRFGVDFLGLDLGLGLEVFLGLDIEVFLGLEFCIYL